MSLYGALFSGVSGLTSQSSAMGAISDNITNVSTVGYKNTQVNFQTLVTKQTSSTFYSAGGVQSKPRGANDVQGLLQATTSQTDFSVSGGGFFVVNEASQPGISNQYLYSRAGEFFQDNAGFLRNTSGYYLQAWPTDASGNVRAANTNLSVANQNIVSTDYLETVNLSRVGGTASSTTSIGVGANLPASDTTGQTHRTDVQFFDSLGNAGNVSFVYTKTGRDNVWDLGIDPPAGTSVLTVEDSSGNATQSAGHVEFTARPADGATIVIDGITYEFDNTGAVGGGNTAVTVTNNTTIAQDVATLVAAIKGADTDFADYGGYTNTRVAVSSTDTATVIFREDGTKAFSVNPAGLLDTSGNPVTKQETTFTVRNVASGYRDFLQFKFPGVPANGETMTINGTVYTFNNAEGAGDNDTTIATGGGVAAMLADLESAMEANDSLFAGTRVRVRQDSNSGAVDTLVLDVLPSGSYNVVFSNPFANNPTDPSGVLTYADGGTTAIDKSYALVFDSKGLPSAINVSELEILGFTNGSADMDDSTTNVSQIGLDFGTVGEANGMTQFGAAYSPTFITQNGSRFGTFSGVSVNTSGLVTALFDNGETRTVFKIPVATFVSPAQLENRSGNVWSSTEASGDYTLREPDNGPAGQVVQAALESSTVDIGEEFTNMIVVQRAYSASAKIISTADEMLEELMRTKR